MSKELHTPEGLQPESREGITRREFLKTAGIFGALFAGKPREAAVLLEEAVGVKECGDKVKVVFRFFNAMHRTVKDVEGLVEEIKKADIYIPEAVGWTDEALSDYKAITRGEMTPIEFLKERGVVEEDAALNHRYKELMALFNSQKKIILVDLPAGHPVYKKYRERRVVPRDVSRTFPEALTSTKRELKDFAEALVTRENYIIAEIAKVKENIERGRYPELKDKKDVNILIFLGAAHTRVYHKIKEIEDETTRRFSVMPFQYSNHALEIVRRFMFGKEVGDELAAKAFFSGHVSGLPFWASISDTHKASMYQRAIVEQFSYKEIEDFFNDLQHTEFSSHSLVLRRLVDKNIKIPKSDAELDEILEKMKRT